MMYEENIRREALQWQKKMLRKPSFLDYKTAGLQQKINSFIPEKVHHAVTAAIKNMVKAVLFGSMHTSAKRREGLQPEATEYLVKEKIRHYKNTAAAEGGLTGMGGILTGLADFPLFLSIKIKMLFEIATLYGYDVALVSERLYILHIFQLAFSSQQHRRDVMQIILNWERQPSAQDIHSFDWRTFQQEYRDYIDIPKLAQLLPGVGAIVGFVVNRSLTQRLGDFAMNAYRLRRLQLT